MTPKTTDDIICDGGINYLIEYHEPEMAPLATITTVTVIIIITMQLVTHNAI